MATKMFGSAFPEWFGTIGASAYTLFQVMTLESWSMGIVRPVMEVYSYAWVFFVPFILCPCIRERHDQCECKLTVRADLLGATLRALVPRAPNVDLCPGRLATTDAQ